jgi:hypothetical protein
MRLPIVFAVGLAISVLVAALTLVSGEPPWLAGVALATGIIVVIVIGVSLPGEGRVVAGAVPWRGAERRALMVPLSRFKVASVYLLVAATLGFIGFITVMAFIQDSTPEWAHLVTFTVIAAAALAVCVSVIVGPNELALLRDGILLRRGLQARFIPWDAVVDIERVTPWGTDSVESLRVRVRAPDLVHSTWLGRMRFNHDLSIPMFFFDMPADESFSTVVRTWRDPESVERAGPVGTPQALRAPHEAIRTGLDMVVDCSAEFAIFHADKARNRYVQAITDRDGQLRIEAVSNPNLRSGSKLNGRAVARLAELGWEAPIAPSDNFWMSLRAESTADIERAADVLLQTLHDVYGLPSDGRPIALLAAGGHTFEVG